MSTPGRNSPATAINLDGWPLPSEAAAAVVRIDASMSYIEGLPSRIACGVAAAADDLRAELASVASSLASPRRDFAANCRSILKIRSKWMDEQVEEIDAVEKSLIACARAAMSPGDDPVAVYADLDTTLPVMNESVLPRVSLLVDVPYLCFQDAVAFTECARLQSDVDLSQCVFSGSGASCYQYESKDSAIEDNTIVFQLRDSEGVPVRGIVPQDVHAELVCVHDRDCTLFDVSNAPREDPYSLKYCYTVPKDVAPVPATLSFRVSVFSNARTRFIQVPHTSIKFCVISRLLNVHAIICQFAGLLFDYGETSAQYSLGRKQYTRHWCWERRPRCEPRWRHTSRVECHQCPHLPVYAAGGEACDHVWRRAWSSRQWT